MPKGPYIYMPLRTANIQKSGSGPSWQNGPERHAKQAPPVPPGPTSSPIKLIESTVSKRFPPGFLSDLRPSHLREAVLCPSPDQTNRLLFSLTSMVNLPPTIIPHLCGATLIAIRKKCRGLRPIAIGVSSLAHFEMPRILDPTHCSSPLSPKLAGRWRKRGLRSNHPRSIQPLLLKPQWQVLDSPCRFF